MFFWVHGGNYETGSGADALYNGTFIVKRAQKLYAQSKTSNVTSGSGLVVVTVNYRLGVFGYLGGEQLRSESPSGASGNWGQGDQRLAMKWVQQYISDFGGDPDKVLLMGESSGGTSVGVHLTSEASWGLFHKVIMESPGLTQTKQMADASEYRLDRIQRFVDRHIRTYLTQSC